MEEPHPPPVLKSNLMLSHNSNLETMRKLISPCRSLLVAELYGLLVSLAGRLVSRMLLFLATRPDRLAGSLVTLRSATNMSNNIPEK
jgi:hypothetical protein